MDKKLPEYGLPCGPASVRPIRMGSPTDPNIPRRRLAIWRIVMAFGVAGCSDFLSLTFSLLVPIQWTVDVGTALLLWALLGWRWAILPALIAEAIPGLEIFPFWILVVGVIGATATRPGAPPKNLWNP